MKIYIASNIHHRDRWRALRDAGVPFISSWLDHPDAENLVELWDCCTTEPAEADVTIIYTESADTPRGSLVECGVALGAGKHVIQVGTCGNLQANGRSDASFTKHRNWRQVPTIEDALQLAQLIVAASFED